MLACEQIAIALSKDRYFVVGKLEEEIDALPLIDLRFFFGGQLAVAVNKLEEGVKSGPCWINGSGVR
jgi:hypothetical protein